MHEGTPEHVGVSTVHASPPRRSHSKEKRVLYVSYDGMTDALGQSQVLPYLRALADEGHHITVLSCEKREKAEATLGRGRGTDGILHHGMAWRFVHYTKQPPVLSTFWDLLKMYRIAVREARHSTYDVIHCRTVLACLVGYSLKARHLKDARFIFDIRGLWADERVDGGLWPQTHPIYRTLYRAFKRAESFYLRKADHIVTLTARAKAHIEAQEFGGEVQATITVIPCCVDMARFSRSNVKDTDVAECRTAMGLSAENFVLLYLGSLGTRYMLGSMMQLFSRIHRDRPDARFLVVTTDDPGIAHLEAEKLGLPADAVLVTASSYEDVPTWICLADASAFFIYTGNSGLAVSPTKQAELLSMGVPIICNAGIGDSEKILAESGSGIIIDPLTDKAFDAAVKQLDALTCLPHEHMRQVAEEHFSLSEGFQRYHRIYSSW